MQPLKAVAQCMCPPRMHTCDFCRGFSCGCCFAPEQGLGDEQWIQWILADLSPADTLARKMLWVRLARLRPLCCLNTTQCFRWKTNLRPS